MIKHSRPTKPRSLTTTSAFTGKVAVLPTFVATTTSSTTTTATATASSATTSGVSTTTTAFTLAASSTTSSTAITTAASSIATASTVSTVTSAVSTSVATVSITVSTVSTSATTITTISATSAAARSSRDRCSIRPGDINSLATAIIAGLNHVLYFLTIRQATETLRSDSGLVNKEIARTIFRSYEPKALLVTEPLDDSLAPLFSLIRHFFTSQTETLKTLRMCSLWNCHRAVSQQGDAYVIY
ncbi:hypothetical protein H5410_010032 [Solanum commersonii]|uniref:Uncharacterized protein n=1 Tax=Solanum commersonii TaxID=4109 RepID=A0A9J6AJL6_SOLCO|nr:hypothetical protein H5410_010032 [Solanum commersonii]